MKNYLLKIFYHLCLVEATLRIDNGQQVSELTKRFFRFKEYTSSK